VTVRTASFADLDATTLYEILRLRVDVFVVEQRCPYPELDGRDREAATVHVWVEHDGRPVAYLRILQDPQSARIGRVCTDPAHRGTGLSAELLAAALERVGDDPCVLDAQSHLTAFYERWGFAATGAEFLEDGIPHVPMRRPPRDNYGSAATSSATERRLPV